MSVFTRRTALRGFAAIAGASSFSFGSRAQGLKKVNMRLDWLYQGPNVGFMVAQAKGYYKEAGLDVDIGPGKGSGSTAQLVASKATQIGFVDGFVVGNSIAKGLDIKSIASIYRRNPSAIIVLAESDIKTPKELEGKSLAMATGSAQFHQWPAFAKGAGIDVGKVKLISLDPAGVTTALLNKQVPAIGGFAQGYVPSIEIRGKKEARIFWYADQGVTVVSNGIVVHNDFFKSDRSLLKDFVPPSIKGFLYARANPQEALEILKKYAETITPEISMREMEFSWKTWVTPATRGKPLGWAAPSDWQATVDVLKQYGGVTTPLEADQIYTNDLVPMGAEFIPPQEA